jgi:hypothetical protein
VDVHVFMELMEDWKRERERVFCCEGERRGEME